MKSAGPASRTVAFAVIACAAILLLPATGHAQSPLGIGSAEPSAMPSGTGWQILAFINERQQAFYRAMTGALKAMRSDPSKLALLIGLSFAYGVFHAAGPGHGKAVISSYMLANEVALRRGVVLSFVSALLQGATALLVVAAAWLALRGTAVSMTDATHFMELASYLLIAAFGAWLLWRKAALALRRSPATHHSSLSVAGHASDHSHARAHQHDGAVCASCGHAHAPDPALINGRDLSLREAATAVIAVGLRPCSGALLVLTFALLNGLFLGGVLSVLAMSIGTAITVSILATLAVGAKGLALRYAGDRRAAGVGTAIELAGAALILALGLVLFTAAL
ncbi:nickel/cobalt transporter [Pseudohoeflea coraliihabitans]|uniref:nickel/cobalt transporter n=1 Tax=Pseudohoeflea coraliihabitans TaxID=2860393 RepID=UPI003D162C78